MVFAPQIENRENEIKLASWDGNCSYKMSDLNEEVHREIMI